MEMVIVYWRDIAAQVIVKRGRTRGKAELHVRFQEAIDRAAMRAGKGSSDLYLEEWRRDTKTIAPADDLQAFATEHATHLAEQFSDDDLLKLIQNKGKQPVENTQETS